MAIEAIIPKTSRFLTDDGTIVPFGPLPAKDKPKVYETLEWAMTRLPDFEGKKALILPGAWYPPTVALFAEANFSRANSVEEADVVVFIGGEDVDPSLYGQKALAGTHFNKERDKTEVDIYAHCLALKKPMFGICRGGQFLATMNGAELWQDVNHHAGSHHEIYDIDEDVKLTTNSYHHQMVILHDKLDVLAVTNHQVATRFASDSMVVDLDKKGANQEGEIEVEAGYYYDTGCFFTQGHPEVGSPEYRSWVMTKLYDFLSSPHDDPFTGGKNKSKLVESDLELWRQVALM